MICNIGNTRPTLTGTASLEGSCIHELASAVLLSMFPVVSMNTFSSKMPRCGHRHGVAGGQLRSCVGL